MGPEHVRKCGHFSRLKPLRSAYDPLMRCVRVAELEDPPAVADRSRALLEAVYETNRSLYGPAQGNTDDARDRFADARGKFNHCFEGFLAAAQTAINES